MFEIAVQRCLPRAGMDGDVILLVEPPVKGLIEFSRESPSGYVLRNCMRRVRKNRSIFPR
ncbi:MAG: hypothetical protein AUK24_00510 [Syntrophaceae bacterium CG2_30_49_12]|nr:MAG: hypothetical protein AUK24_00510 [Syntrophaceae bacterium CG2_30_49_12]PIP06008.1 MAG: hypothetical protein COX52_08765 [Syntrophobacterales bacterium CG23_combo_of_CG06-09_8_20_14_all_48_27]PJA48580.1 MAG: hypothetical protein CO171_07000 [Syntrophobacterales bacterium CG_4_9_14_3_um_filter_49_8]PJC73463.1 MAG: hypothetical protein CO012_09170 [Syntrophobacterales bacterium CG_4_8_14_3_um_filter_49_14]